MISIASSRPQKKRGNFKKVLGQVGISLGEFPLISFESLANAKTSFDQQYKWGILSSAETLDHLSDDDLNKISSWFCVGEKCSEALSSRGMKSFYTTDKKSMNGLLEDLNKKNLITSQELILYPCSQEAEWSEQEVNTKFDLKIKRVDCYCVKPVDQSSKIIEIRPQSWIHFSGSAVRALKEQTKEAQEIIKGALHIAWGKSAAKELQKMNLNYVYLDHSAPDENWAKELKEKIKDKL